MQTFTFNNTTYSNELIAMMFIGMNATEDLNYDGSLSININNARKVYNEAITVISKGNKVYFTIPVEMLTDSETYPVHLIGNLIIEIDKSKNTATVSNAHNFCDESILNPDYNNGIKVLKGNLSNFLD